MTDVLVVGAGIIGLSTAASLLRRHPALSLLVIDKEGSVATHQTGRNSGVIHTGFYYEPGSLKAALTVAGHRALIDLCEARGVPWARCGKVVVATRSAELGRLEELARRGTENGVEGLEVVGPKRLRELEPAAAGLGALWVPGGAIVDYVAVCRRLVEEIHSRGGEVRPGTRLLAGERVGGRWALDTTAGPLHALGIVACAGLQADRIARATGVEPSIRIVPFRGEYYRLRPEHRGLVRRLVYPVPDPRLPFLGPHFTPTIGGELEVGPNAVLSLKREGYERHAFDRQDALEALTDPGFLRLAARHWRAGGVELLRAASRRAFARSLRRMVPALRASSLGEWRAGVRAQALHRDGRLAADFEIEAVEGAVHVMNAPSPAATAALPIGDVVAERAGEVLGLGAPIN